MYSKSYRNKLKMLYAKMIKFRQTTPCLEVFTDVHHIIPLEFGGTSDESNLVRVSLKEHKYLHMLLDRVHGAKVLGKNSIAKQASALKSTRLTRQVKRFNKKQKNDENPQKIARRTMNKFVSERKQAFQEYFDKVLQDFAVHVGIDTTLVNVHFDKKVYGRLMEALTSATHYDQQKKVA